MKPEAELNVVHEEEHLPYDVFDPKCENCQHEVEALEWVECVRKYGLIKANEMFPEDQP